MKSEQVEAYLDFIRDTCVGVLYSRNQDRQPKNAELSSLSQMLRARFQITPVPEWQPPGKGPVPLRRRLRSLARSLASGLGLLEPVKQDTPYLAFICTPLRSAKAQ
jgi:hypothetical protein